MIAKNNFHATIVAMYLAKFNKQANLNLGYKTFNDAFNDISIKLNLNGQYLKLRRDEFDPFFEWRKGWRNRPVDKTCIQVYEYYNNLSEHSFRDIVVKLINGNTDIVDSNTILLKSAIEEIDDKIGYTYSTRGLTGKSAERYFTENFQDIETFSECSINDCRDNGCGYDFEILQGSDIKYYIEVKCVTNTKCGLLFTDKEWATAQLFKDKYILCIVDFSNDKKTQIHVVANPADRIEAQKYTYTSIQVNWNVTANQLKNVKNLP